MVPVPEDSSIVLGGQGQLLNDRADQPLQLRQEVLKAQNVINIPAPLRYPILEISQSGHQYQPQKMFWIKIILFGSVPVKITRILIDLDPQNCFNTSVRISVE